VGDSGRKKKEWGGRRNRVTKSTEKKKKSKSSRIAQKRGLGRACPRRERRQAGRKEKGVPADRRGGVPSRWNRCTSRRKGRQKRVKDEANEGTASARGAVILDSLVT